MLRAKDGYAVGAISGKANQWCHGFSLTFMKVKPDGTLDPKDSYESEWVGYTSPKPIQKLGGDGTPVVGLAGKSNGQEVNGLGLLNQVPEPGSALLVAVLGGVCLLVRRRHRQF